jgi:hypothetical protein
MNFDPNAYDLSKHIRIFDLGSGEWISLRNKLFPAESVNPSGEGRFHHFGEAAYYAANRIETARLEVFPDASGAIPDTHEVFTFPPGEYHLLDMDSFINENPEASGLLDPNSHQDGQRFRTALEGISCSGVMFPSVRDPEGINASVWPLDGSPLPERKWFQLYTGPR